MKSVNPTPSKDSQDPSEDGESPTGLVAIYRSAPGGRESFRVDPDVQFQWSTASPDPRIANGPFEAQWTGKLFVAVKGRYRFHLFTTGTARMSVDAKRVIDGMNHEPGWLTSAELPLDLGQHTIELVYKKKAGQAHIGLYWESNKFPLEPIGPRWLSHDPLAGGEPRDFERGSELARAYRCAACHDVPGIEPDRKAPALDHLADRIKPDWLVRSLEDSHRVRAHSRMPDLGLTTGESRAVAAFLMSNSKKEAVNARNASPNGRADTGGDLFRSLGCMACHTLDANGTIDLFSGGPLDGIADKRPATFFREWLVKPESINAAHRMPTFVLKKEEVEDLSSFLATLTGPKHLDNSKEFNLIKSATQQELDLGKRLIVEHRCAACHDVPNIEPPKSDRVALYKDSGNKRRADWITSCLGNPDKSRHRPGYRLNEQDRRAIKTYFDQLPVQVAKQSQYEHGRRLFRELNCAACHARDLEPGLQPGSLEKNGAAGAEVDLARLRGELEPPSLTSVGDKFHEPTLSKLIDGGLTQRRPWLRVRMPRFVHSDFERHALLAFLIDHDRIPRPSPAPVVMKIDSAPVPTKTRTDRDVPGAAVSPVAAFDPADALVAGHQLVSSRGFGCMSCHTVGKHQPKGVAVNARGSDLLRIGDRVRHEWFVRWVRDPARIVPGMEMPAITVAVRGLLDDRVDLQLESLWQALNSSAFVVPSDRDTAQQIISLKPGDTPVILRDVLFDCPPGSGWCARPFAIGLPNRHNVLFDLDAMSLRSWWIGDFARERTEGKTWLWEPGGLAVWRRAGTRTSLAIKNQRSGQLELPIKRGQSIGRLLRWSAGDFAQDAGPARVSFTYELGFPSAPTVTVSEHLLEDRDERRGFRREISVTGLSPGYLAVLLVSATEDAVHDASDIIQPGPLGETTIHSRTHDEPRPAWQRFSALDEPEMKVRCFGVPLSPVAADSPGTYGAVLEYRGPDSGGSSAPNDITVPPLRPQAAKELQVAPGFDVIRLPLDPSVMPSAIAVLPNETPVVCSLKGSIFLAEDQDGDGLCETWKGHGDHLGAPFGVLADDSAIFVTHKAELLAFRRHAANEYSRFPDVLATGWGLTEDYHDWTFGLVRDTEGQFYISTGSDYTHRARPAEARKWRGRILRVSRNGHIEEIARGARYPTGLAINRDGQLFFTDNQGVQNTFNEINHVIPGSRYGVPALDDPPPDKDLWPERTAAIQIPHPWTRSINGICFLYAGGKWGAFEGHGIGCEYDTRGLIRFSLQKIGDTYQGACYPLTLPEDQVPEGERLLGPICCAVSPNGDLYIGGIRDSGWGGGNNVGELLRVRPAGQVPLGIREVRAWRDGFVVDFTAPVDPHLATDPTKYTITSYHRVWQGTYATPDSDRRAEKIRTIQLSEDRRSAVLTLDSMRPGYVYDIHLADIGPDSTSLWPADAYYTLNAVPDITP